MTTFLDILDAFIKKYKQPYTIYDWVKQMHPENQGFSKIRKFKFINGYLYKSDTERFLVTFNEICESSFLWTNFNKKFYRKSKNFIPIEYISDYIEKHILFQKIRFYDPKKFYITNNFQLISIKSKNMKKFKNKKFF